MAESSRLNEYFGIKINGLYGRQNKNNIDEK